MSRESSATATVPTVGDSMDVGSSSQEEMIAGKDSTPAVVGEEVSQGVDDDGAPASGSHNDHGQTTLTQEAEHEAMPAASAPKRESRLLITKMQMENFKSYGGLREIGPFHKCFSSIVGPNGSGKSNVIDAMLFVFGKRAKKLRLNKVSELIHRSDTYPNLEYARVSVHFVDILDVEGSEDDYEEVNVCYVIILAPELMVLLFGCIRCQGTAPHFITQVQQQLQFLHPATCMASVIPRALPVLS